MWPLVFPATSPQLWSFLRGREPHLPMGRVPWGAGASIPDTQVPKVEGGWRFEVRLSSWSNSHFKLKYKLWYSKFTVTHTHFRWSCLKEASLTRCKLPILKWAVQDSETPKIVLVTQFLAVHDFIILSGTNWFSKIILSWRKNQKLHHVQGIKKRNQMNCCLKCRLLKCWVGFINQ